MWNVLARLRLVAFGLGVLAAGSAVEASVLSLKAVKRTRGAVVTPFNPPVASVDVLGDDIIEAEIFLSGWINDFPNDNVPNNVRIFQATIAGVGFISPDNGVALPLGWEAPVDRIDCTVSATCPATYPICAPPWGCTRAGHNPALGAFMTRSRPDFLLFGLEGFFDIDTGELRFFKYFGLVFESVGTPDTGVPRYLGTLILKVSANACGTFTIGFIQAIDSTFISEPANPPNSVLPTLQPLVLTVSDCSRQLLSCSPIHCNVDARIATDRPNCTQRLNTDRIEMTFSKPTTGMKT